MFPEHLPKHFLSSSLSKEEFLKEYNKLYDGKEGKQFYISILMELKNAVKLGNTGNFKKLTNLIELVSNVESTTVLRDYYKDEANPIKNTNLVILACKYGKIKILQILFSNFEVLKFVSPGILTPKDVDGACHNTFYYAIRSGNSELLELLINEWPGNYFEVNSMELDEIISTAYEELKLKNVPLLKEMEMFIENKLMNLRFFSACSEVDFCPDFIDDSYAIKCRIHLVLDNISLLVPAHCSKEKQIDERFIYVAKFVAQNIHVLKQLLKSTYDKLPWEEIEFCLVCFASSHLKQQKLNLFNHSILTKSKILRHLQNFAKKLKDIFEEINIYKSTNLPNLKRKYVVEEIIRNFPQFEELYSDYQQIRDIHSLDTISNYLKLALSANPNEREGQIIITRVLQVIGEYLKDTLESPKLSSSTSELLLMTLPKNTREIITGLRNSLSHANSLHKRKEIEDNKNSGFFTCVLNDVKKIGEVITDILHKSKIRIIKMLLTNILTCNDMNEIKEFAQIFSCINITEFISADFQTTEFQQFVKVVEELCDSVNDKTSHEHDLINKINGIMKVEKAKVETMNINYILGFNAIKAINMFLNDNKLDDSVIRDVKCQASSTLQFLASKINSQSLKEIAELSFKLSKSVSSRSEKNSFDKIERLVMKIFYIAEFELGNIKWIEELRHMLNKKPSACKQTTTVLSAEKYNEELELKLSELKVILNKNSLNQLDKSFSVYKNDKKLQAIVEMLVLDIMSILGSSKKCLENNLLFLDDKIPLLTGKSLRNHLAHYNILVDVLLSDPSFAIVLNAKILTSENIKGSQKLGKSVKDDPSKLKDKYVQGLIVLDNQEKLFLTVEEGNIEKLKICLKNGADVNARNINSWTALHFAAKGSSVEIIKFLLDQNLSAIIKDANGQLPLHIAALYGKSNIVEFFVKEIGVNVDVVDDWHKTPLHIAAKNNHKHTVEVLLKYKAKTVIPDKSGISPLHYAIRNGHVDVAKILLKKDVNVDINEAIGGFTPLHEAAARGYLDLVNFLLENKANVNAKNDSDWTPLFAAAHNGHLEIVNALIEKGANVNAVLVDGGTPVCYAAQNGHEDIVSILLKNGAKLNAFHRTSHQTPLHYAAEGGYESLVKTLLQNKANVNAVTVQGITPLHLAAKGGYIQIALAILEQGVDINAKDTNFLTPLHVAVQNNQIPIIKLLLKNQALLSCKDYDGNTPLHIAVLEGHKDVIDILLKNNAEINGKRRDGFSPLHLAVLKGRSIIVECLIKNKADVDVRDNDGFTPLHIAAQEGYKDVSATLLRNKAKVNARSKMNLTPLHAAASNGHHDVIHILLKNNADVNARDKSDCSPLLAAIKSGHRNVMNVLLTNGAIIHKNEDAKNSLLFAVKSNSKEIIEDLLAEVDVNVYGKEALFLAVHAGYRDILHILLKNYVSINVKMDGSTLLHMAALQGHKEIVKDLLLKGAYVNVFDKDNVAPLFLAAKSGYEEIVEILLKNGAHIDAKGLAGLTSLYAAATLGNSKVVKVLLDYNANIEITDCIQNRTAIEAAALGGYIQVIDEFLHHVDINHKFKDGWTLLHIAAEGNKIEMVKYLLSKGSYIKAKNDPGAMPIHIAAKEGFIDIVKFLFTKGSRVTDLGFCKQTVLHYAAISGNLDIIKHLISLGADVNAKDANALTPIHVASCFDYKDVIKLLLKHGASYNAIDVRNQKPLNMTKNKDVIKLFMLTERLFEAVKHNSSLDVENCIKEGAVVNARNADNWTSLHYAAWKGYTSVISILLKNNCNPNAVGNKGFTPLHYAAKFSHLGIVKALLCNGAIYDSLSDTGKMPLNFSSDENIIALFKLVGESYENVINKNSKLISNLKKIKDIDTVKAIMNCRNRENKTLIVTAIHNNFSKVEELKHILQGDDSLEVKSALALFNMNNFELAFNILTDVFEKRKQMLGPDNPGTLDIQAHIAKILYKQGLYRESLDMYEELFQKQKEILGLNNKDTLVTRSMIALILHKQDKNEEAMSIYREVYQKQREVLGPNHTDTLDTQLYMAIALLAVGEYEEALRNNQEVYQKRLETNNITYLLAQNNIALVLSSQGKYEKALKVYNEVYKKKKKVFGATHASTLGTLQNIAGIYLNQKKYPEAIRAHDDLISIQTEALGPDHIDTLNSQHNKANILMAQGKWVGALKIFNQILQKRIAIYGENHSSVLDILAKLEMINLRLKHENRSASSILSQNIITAADNGDADSIKYLLLNGDNVNERDVEGRTPLYFAINNGNMNIVSILLNNGADVFQVTKKGNTPLHIAVSKNYKGIVKILLEHIDQNKLGDFINFQTFVGRNTALHVAAKNNSYDIVLSLLEYGASFNIKNGETKIPVELSKKPNVKNLLKLIAGCFEDSYNGNVSVISKLKAVKAEEMLAVTNARNKNGKTILQVAIMQKHRILVLELVKLLKE